ncbi:MAG TPA: helix-turn-helix transcriptional regulator [Anaeromyxobacteraceae bacterium]|nr:helix-turn-helix transcriptional regulator [Anaeromyxobacteraceae bacterium]
MRTEPAREMLAALGRRVREARVRRGLTQLDLAQAAELSVAYVSLIERGGRNPPLTTVVSLARALGVGVTELVT